MNDPHHTVCSFRGLEIVHRKQESRGNNNTPPVIHSGVEAQKLDNIQKFPKVVAFYIGSPGWAKIYTNLVKLLG